MKTKLLLLSALSLIASVFLLPSCIHTSAEIYHIDPAFGNYISGYTSGMISRKGTIRIELAKSYFEIHPSAKKFTTGGIIYPESTPVPDSTILENIFSFSPAIKGRAVWVNERIIEFIPDQLLPVNQLYVAEFDLDEIQTVPDELETFRFQFSTYPQNLFVDINGLRVYDYYNIESQRLWGKLTTSDFADSSLLSKTIKVIQNGKTLPVIIEKGYELNEYNFFVDSIKRSDKASSISVTWSGETIGALQKGKQEMTVPGLGDFYVNQANVVDEGDQYVELVFSESIAPDQNLNGIITIKNQGNLTFAVDGNTVRVYSPVRLSGSKIIKVSAGIRNFKGYKMNEAYSNELTFDEPRPFVRVKGNGCILPNSNGLIFPFEAISLKSVNVRIIKIFENNVHQFLQVNDLDGESQLMRVGKVIAEKKLYLNTNKKTDLKQWNQFVINLNDLISPDPGSIYRVSIKYEKEDAICNCPVIPGAEPSPDPDEEEDDPNWSENNWYGYGFDGGYDTWYDYNEGYSACDESYYYGKAVSRNILASDIGLIYKQDDNKQSHAFVTNMLTAKPLAGATIEYYDYARQLIASGKSDAQGMLDLPLTRKPFVMLAKYGKQRGYLKLLDGDVNSLSKFDISGEVVQKGVKGFIYGERGVWRPGDSLFLSFIMEDKEHRLPPGHPVKFELQDPNGQTIYQCTKTKSNNNLFDFRTATNTDAPTGNYMAIARVGNRYFSQTIKIETIKPNRLKIYLNTASQQADSNMTLQAKWLHGAIAKNLKATVQMSVNQSKTHFDHYNAYEFDSPVRNFYTDADVVFDGNLNEKGEASFTSKINAGQAAPGMLRATYITKVFEEGGDFSIDRYSMPYSPYKLYVGLKTPETKGYDLAFETGKRYSFDVATVDATGKPTSANRLQVKIYKMQWRWWYESEREDMATYIAKSGCIIAKDTIIKTSEGKGKFSFQINYPEYGRYLITVTDLNGGHQTGKLVYIDWPYWSRANRSNNENASMLNFACDRTSYTSGEAVKLSFPSPSDGMALVSIESGTRVLKKFWIPTKKGETVYQFPATADMAPTSYIHVTLIQPHASTKNDLPIRMYGVVPINVDDPKTHLWPEISMQDVLKPESTTSIKVTEKNKRKMTYTLAIVDEGLLDLTRFKTPQPWSTFYAREALGVKTWDMYNSVIGAYAGKLDKLLSVGGDGDGMNGKGIKANRFKPMVKFIGPFTLEAGSEKTHRVQIPNYIGSVRVMIVAENEGAYGNVEKTVAVRKPLMILATLPRVLGPGETVSLPVNVFAMEKHVKDVKVEVETNEFLQITGQKQQSIHFNETGDEVLNFNLKVPEKTGIAKVKVTARCGKETATQEIELDVRTANPKVTEGYELSIEPGKSATADIHFKGIAGTNKATIEFSSVPPMDLEKRLDYLIQYPHGCIEQTTSSVFPQLYVTNLLDPDEKQKQNISAHIKAGLKRLELFQTADGGFAYWPGESYNNEWGSNYAGHFMLEAEQQGYTISSSMKSRWINYQKERAKNWTNDNPYKYSHYSESNQLIQAYRLYVLALANQPELGAMNRLKEEKGLTTAAMWRLAAAYYLAGQKEVALGMTKNLNVNINTYKELSDSYGSGLRDKAMILEVLSLMDEKTKATALAKEIAQNLSSKSWLSTQETAYCLLAMSEFAGRKSNTVMSFSYSLNGSAPKQNSSRKPVSQVKYRDRDFAADGAVSIENTSKQVLFVKVINEGVPMQDDKSAAGHDLKMQVVYKNSKGEIIQPDRLIQGTDFTAEVTITNPGSKGYLKEMALNQIFPSGWEIHNSRMDENGYTTPARYQDIRDDRVYSYYELNENATKTFTIRLNATYLGRFYLPSVYTEAMYDHLINAKIPGRWVEVVKDSAPVAKK